MESERDYTETSSIWLPLQNLHAHSGAAELTLSIISVLKFHTVQIYFPLNHNYLTLSGLLYCSTSYTLTTEILLCNYVITGTDHLCLGVTSRSRERGSDEQITWTTGSSELAFLPCLVQLKHVSVEWFSVLATGLLRLTTSNSIFQLNTCAYSPYVTSSLTRGSFCRLQLLLALASTVILRSESRWTHDHILLSQIRDSTNLEGQVRVFIFPRNIVSELCP
jgi:hypothetical protein